MLFGSTPFSLSDRFWEKQPFNLNGKRGFDLSADSDRSADHSVKFNSEKLTGARRGP